MSIIKKIIFLSILIPIISLSDSFAEDLKKVGKFKDWEALVLNDDTGKVCFAQSIPVLQTPKNNTVIDTPIINFIVFRMYLSKTV